ncbi:hypothetical protein [Paenibacillus sp. MMS20-IR301]|uniref:hypothetical protein n=1 Tax=Paenibacillus sp. MMS20-IR301 TaxID=2895946 RepID=UPI0028E4DAC7|nr:hypothetical protein [Paenibacillus sp. MMS20-IR301]WNS45327.1 hypothetical protein LOS79_08665 [Paenibacillus sp. MMS20-IR301]
MRTITDEEARRAGIETRHDLMDSGERRFRLNCAADGSSYCRTVASAEGAWQNSHYHNSVSELYVVQSGWMVYAELQQEELKLHLLAEGGSVTVKPLVPHNIYLSADSVIHTIKYGKAQDNDWHASPELDVLTRHLPPEQLLPLE